MAEQIVYASKDIFFSVASILVFNENGQVLVLRRSRWKNIPGNDYRPDLSHTLDLPGGIVADGDDFESERAGAVRELEEETGVKSNREDSQLVYSETKYDENARRSIVKLLYLLKLDHTPDVQLSWEHEAFYWRDLSDVANDNGIQGFKSRAINYVAKHRSLYGV